MREPMYPLGAEDARRVAVARDGTIRSNDPDPFT